MCCGKKKMISWLFVEGKVLAGNACALREIAHDAGGTHLKWLFREVCSGLSPPQDRLRTVIRGHGDTAQGPQA